MTLRKKIVLLGDSAVGKTSLIRRYVFDRFEDSYISTIGTKVTLKELRIQTEKKDVDLTFMIWDLIGREGYHSLHARSFEGVQGAILVADLTRKETLASLERYWIPSLFKVVDSVPLIFACNKSDLYEEFEFDYEDLAEVASRYNVGYDDRLPQWLGTSFSTSAKEGSKVEEVFESLGHLVLFTQKEEDPVKDLYERLVATHTQRTSDRRTIVGALDAIVVDFCDGFDDYRLAMPILRQEIIRAGIDVRNPSKEGVLKVVEYLAEAESEFKDEKTVVSNLEKRHKWAKNVV